MGCERTTHEGDEARVGGGVFHREADRVRAEGRAHRGGAAEENTVRTAASHDGRGGGAIGRTMAEKEIGDAGEDVPAERAEVDGKLFAGGGGLGIARGVVSGVL